MDQILNSDYSLHFVAFIMNGTEWNEEHPYVFFSTSHMMVAHREAAGVTLVRKVDTRNPIYPIFQNI